MATIQTVQEQPTEHDAAEGAGCDARTPDEPRASPAAHRRGSADGPTATAVDERRRERRPLLGQTAAVTIIAALIAAMTLATITAFNTLRSDIISVRTELRDELTGEIGSLRTEMREEIASVRTELREFRTEVSTVLLDHTERLARIEALILNGAIGSSQQP